jgi:hypothetical protein
MGTDVKTLTLEQVKPLPGYAGYFVSRHGRICGPRGNWLAGQVDRWGYGYYVIRRRSIRIHRAVLEAWVGSRPTGHECRHLDGDKSNNELSNLAWGTAKQNADDKRSHGAHPYGERTNVAKVSEADVRQIRTLLNSGDMSQRVIGAMFGISHTEVGRIGHRTRWGHVRDIPGCDCEFCADVAKNVAEDDVTRA